MDQGASNKADFLRVLKQRYGNLHRAWRQALDLDANGRLSFVEFCQAVRAIGYVGNLRKLWDELDADHSGTISLEEICPDADKEINEFRRILSEKYGNTIKAWKHGLDVQRQGRVH